MFFHPPGCFIIQVGISDGQGSQASNFLLVFYVGMKVQLPLCGFIRPQYTILNHFWNIFLKLLTKVRQRVDNERITKFFRDRELLQAYNDTHIASKMAMDKSNYSSYVNRRKTITNSFLKKFYDQFGKELQEIAEKHTQVLKEAEDIYAKPDPIIPDLIEACKKLERMSDRLIETDQLLIKEIYRLEIKLDTLLERLDKIEALLLKLVESRFEASSVSKRSSSMHKKKPGD